MPYLQICFWKLQAVACRTDLLSNKELFHTFYYDLNLPHVDRLNMVMTLRLMPRQECYIKPHSKPILIWALFSYYIK